MSRNNMNNARRSRSGTASSSSPAEIAAALHSGKGKIMSVLAWPNLPEMNKLVEVSRKRAHGLTSEVTQAQEGAQIVKRLKTLAVPSDQISTILGQVFEANAALEKTDKTPDVVDVPPDVMLHAKQTMWRNGLENTAAQEISHEALQAVFSRWQESYVRHKPLFENIVKAINSLSSAMDALPASVVAAQQDMERAATQFSFSLLSDQRPFQGYIASKKEIGEYVAFLTRLQQVAVALAYCACKGIRDQVLPYCSFLLGMLEECPHMVPMVNKEMVDEFMHTIQSDAPLPRRTPKTGLGLRIPLTPANIVGDEFMGLKVCPVEFDKGSEEVKILNALCSKTRDRSFSMPICVGKLETTGKVIFLFEDRPLVPLDRFREVANSKQEECHRASLKLLSGICEFMQELNQELNAVLPFEIGDLCLARDNTLCVRPSAWRGLRALPDTMLNKRIEDRDKVPLHVDEFWTRVYNSVQCAWVGILLFYNAMPAVKPDGTLSFPNNRQAGFLGELANNLTRMCYPNSFTIDNERDVECAFPGNWETIAMMSGNPHGSIVDNATLPEQIKFLDKTDALKDWKSKASSAIYSMTNTVIVSNDRVTDLPFIVNAIASHSSPLICLGGLVSSVDTASGEGASRAFITRVYEMLLRHAIFSTIGGQIVIAPTNRPCDACEGKMCRFHGQKNTYVALGRLFLATFFFGCLFPLPISLTTVSQFFFDPLPGKRSIMGNATAFAALTDLQKYLSCAQEACGEPLPQEEEGKVTYMMAEIKLKPPMGIPLPRTVDLPKIAGVEMPHKRVVTDSIFHVLAEELERNQQETAQIARLIRKEMTLEGYSVGSLDFRNDWIHIYRDPAALSTIRTFLCPSHKIVTAKDFEAGVAFETDSAGQCKFPEQKRIFLDLLCDPESGPLRSKFVRVAFGTTHFDPSHVLSVKITPARAITTTRDAAIQFRLCARTVILPIFSSREQLCMMLDAAMSNASGASDDTFNVV